MEEVTVQYGQVLKVNLPCKGSIYITYTGEVCHSLEEAQRKVPYNIIGEPRQEPKKKYGLFETPFLY